MSRRFGRETCVAAENASYLTEALLLLGGAVVAAPLFKRIGLATVLGYLAAGIAMGPVAALVTDGESLLHVAELGVVLLLFLIGLELNPSRLWAMRRDIFGLGLAQVMVCGLALTVLSLAFTDFTWQASVVIGFALALSSTAFAIQLLEERGDLNRRYGQTGFSILLFQDMAIVPLLALVPLLSPSTEDSTQSALVQFGIAVGCILVLLAAGRYLLNPLFRIIANTGAREAMIAAALFVVLGAAALMNFAGLSMALGAFIAGVMLAESSYRHEIETNVDPFRGILLALFFMAVGLSIDIGVIRDNWLPILIAVPAFMAVKAAIIYALCRVFGSAHDDCVRVALLLPQGGEFGFVIFSAAAGSALFPQTTASLLIALVTLSMALTPLVGGLGRFLIRPATEESMEEDFEGAGSDILMIGFSRFGQIASQVLLSGGADVTIIDHSANRVRAVERFGFRIYFGDGRRRDVLEAAGIRRAKLVAICTNGREATDQIVDLIRHEFPHVKLYVRAYDRNHTLSLRARDVDFELRETFESALRFGGKALEAIGTDETTATNIAEDVRDRDEERLALQALYGGAADSDAMLNHPIAPEPLVRPTRPARRLDPHVDGPDNPERAG